MRGNLDNNSFSRVFFFLLRDFYIKGTRIKMYMIIAAKFPRRRNDHCSSVAACSKTSVAVMCRVILVLEDRSKARDTVISLAGCAAPITPLEGLGGQWHDA